MRTINIAGAATATLAARPAHAGALPGRDGRYVVSQGREVGHDARLELRVDAEGDRLAKVVEDNQTAHTAAGHWGVPTVAFQGEPFFGQDRLDVLRWRLDQAGLKPRQA